MLRFQTVRDKLHKMPSVTVSLRTFPFQCRIFFGQAAKEALFKYEEPQ